MNTLPENGFTMPRTVRVSPEALALARQFGEAIGSVRGGSQVVTFEWATSIRYRNGPDQPEEDLGACLTIGAYRRAQVPPQCIETTDALEFAVKIPAAVWKQSVLRLIDVDDTFPFGLVLH